MALIEFWRSHSSEVTALLVQHLKLVCLSTGIATCIGVPLGIFAARNPRSGAPLVWLAHVAQTSPSLAMFGFLLP
jgi:osmoprotectant transport system permease protein